MDSYYLFINCLLSYFKISLVFGYMKLSYLNLDKKKSVFFSSVYSFKILLAS